MEKEKALELADAAEKLAAQEVGTYLYMLCMHVCHCVVMCACACVSLCSGVSLCVCVCVSMCSHAHVHVCASNCVVICNYYS